MLGPREFSAGYRYTTNCLYIKQLAEALFGAAPKGRAWAKQMRKHMKTTSDGITRV